MPDENKSTETAVDDPAPQEDAANESNETAVETMETKTVEEANASYTGTSVEEQAADADEVDSPSLDTSNAPAFQTQAEPLPEPVPVMLPDDPDGAVMVAKLKNALQVLVPQERNGAKHDMLSAVAQRPTLLSATAQVLTRVLQHEKARRVDLRFDRSETLKVLNDVLIGSEKMHFEANEIGENEICELYQTITPTVIGIL